MNIYVIYSIGLILGLCVCFYKEDLTFFIQTEYQKNISNRHAREITIEFFANARYRNPNITLDEAILKFENGDQYDNLESFAKSKNRTIESYRKAYSQMFKESINLYV